MADFPQETSEARLTGLKPGPLADDLSRRSFLKSAALAGAGTFAARQVAVAQQPTSLPNDGLARDTSQAPVPMKPMGKTGLQVSALGVGGYHLGSAKNQTEVNAIVSRALDAGINFFDNAWDYHDGESEERLGEALKGKRDQAIVMTKVCTHGRDKNVAMMQLEQSLRRLKTDHLDVWQIHEVVYYNDPDLIFRPDGAIEALALAKQQGKVRFVGFTGHKHPDIHLKMLSHGFPFDTVQMPLNPFDANFRSFQQHVLPEANRRGMAVFGMKSLGGSGEFVSHGAVTVADALRYAMSLPVATTISGMESLGVLEQNLEIARGFKPLSHAEMRAIEDRCAKWAADGRYELFKTSTKYDGKVGREQHEYPTVEKLPA
ncbi:MAG TPA: aldo/keto reductase [Acidisarcina sp.]